MSGPQHGATNVTIFGGPFELPATNFTTAERLLGHLNVSGPLTNGSDPRCRFGATGADDLPATVAAEVLNGSAVRCVTPLNNLIVLNQN